jgi:hypothetical protein
MHAMEGIWRCLYTKFTNRLYLSTADKTRAAWAERSLEKSGSSTRCVSVGTHSERPLAVCAGFRGVGMQPVRSAGRASCLGVQEFFLLAPRVAIRARAALALIITHVRGRPRLNFGR